MMDNFSLAFRHMIVHEGGYANDPHDTGGETYAGVSRKNWPNWEGWIIVDRLKPDDRAMIRDEQLQEAVRKFYFINFWMASQASKMPPALARKHFNVAVNAGIKQANKFLQRAAGVTDDGIVGPITLAAIAALDESQLIEDYCQQQRVFYKGIVARKPSQARFLRGWLRRAEYRG